MLRYLQYLIQPGVVATGLMGTILQVGLAFANTMNVGGAADMITNYGLSGQLASGGLIAALTGAYYSMTQRKTASTTATGAGAVAGGISGTLGTAITQAIGWTAIAEGTTQIINFSSMATQFLGLIGMADASTVTDPMFDPAVLTQVFGSTAAGGGIGALLGRTMFGSQKSHARH
ncbi:MAG: hypothetical protein ACKVRO_04565 [Micropepsaceae bacterium]